LVQILHPDAWYTINPLEDVIDTMEDTVKGLGLAGLLTAAQVLLFRTLLVCLKDETVKGGVEFLSERNRRDRGDLVVPCESHPLLERVGVFTQGGICGFIPQYTQ